MMLMEAAAALLLGLGVLWLVFQPLLEPPSREPEFVEPADLEETPRGQALLALKEIEFDLETGKLSEGDYYDLKARYTALALEAMRAEEGPAPVATRFLPLLDKMRGQSTRNSYGCRCRSCRCRFTTGEEGSG
jgi:hypothetical protein